MNADRVGGITHGGRRAPLSLRGVLGLVVKDQKLVFGQRQLRISPRLVVGELDFKNTRDQSLDDGADVAAEQPVLR
jgi:hypothetical protein